MVVLQALEWYIEKSKEHLGNFGVKPKKLFQRQAKYDQRKISGVPKRNFPELLCNYPSELVINGVLHRNNENIKNINWVEKQFMKLQDAVEGDTLKSLVKYFLDTKKFIWNGADISHNNSLLFTLHDSHRTWSLRDIGEATLGTMTPEQERMTKLKGKNPDFVSLITKVCIKLNYFDRKPERLVKALKDCDGDKIAKLKELVPILNELPNLEEVVFDDGTKFHLDHKKSKDKDMSIADLRKAIACLHDAKL